MHSEADAGKSASAGETGATSENWPEAMRKEWSNDEGAAAARHSSRAAASQSLRKTRAQIDEFHPDFIVVWGDDQYENFREDVVPPYCIYAHESFEFGPVHAKQYLE